MTEKGKTMFDFNNTEKLNEQELNEVSGGVKQVRVALFSKVVADFRARLKERKMFAIKSATDDKSVKQTLKKADDMNKGI